ncbi:MAG: NAD(P)H-binding protein [Thermoplasmata archaeon]|nr:NAD(P)H-binding protein [Thermoplasmata archaeon]
MSASGPRPRLLVVGGTGGLVGRAVLAELGSEFQIRSIHRHEVAAESAASVEWIRADVRTLASWGPALEGVDAVLNLAWYRWSSESNFRQLRDGLGRLIADADAAGVPRFVHVSVPDAPERLERGLPYLRYKREIDRQLTESGLSSRIVRPTMLYGPGDRLIGPMLRLMRRYRRFPMFGDGRYHVSPLSASDLGRILRRELHGSTRGSSDLGGPQRYEYRQLTDRMFAALGRPPRYWPMSARSAHRLTGLLVALGSTLLYPYEVDWLVSDRLGVPAYEGLDRPLESVEPYLQAQAHAKSGRGHA